MSKFIEMIAQFFSKLTGSQVEKSTVTGVLIVGVICILMILFARAWCKSEQKQWDELERLEREREEWDD